MKTVFVDTSGFYACLDRTDPFHPNALAAFERAEKYGWKLITTNYVMHETWALVQRRLGWEAVETFLKICFRVARSNGWMRPCIAWARRVANRSGNDVSA